VLEKLKQRHSVTKSSLRRRRYVKTEKSGEPVDDVASTFTGGVLDNLQKRHGRISLKRHPEKSVLETLSPMKGMEHVPESTSRIDCRRKIIESATSKSTSQTKTNEEQTTEYTTPLTQYDQSSLDANYGDRGIQSKSPLHSPGDIDSDSMSNTGAKNNALYAPQHHNMDTPIQAAATSETRNQSTSEQTSSMCIVQKRITRPDLFFSGVVVLVNGHTDPDATTLMRLLHKHGGDLEKYETRRVTHIIAERLSTAKAKIYKNQKNPTPVCRPEWITDSVEKGKLLPFGEYLLQDVMEAKTPGTKSLKSFFGPESCSNEKPNTNRWADTDPSKSNYYINGQVRTVGNDPDFLES
jgi:DNA repair protein REV1